MDPVNYWLTIGMYIGGAISIATILVIVFCMIFCKAPKTKQNYVGFVIFDF